MLRKEERSRTMTYEEVLVEARKHIGTTCKACPVCNWLACGNTLPGPGSSAGTARARRVLRPVSRSSARS